MDRNRRYQILAELGLLTESGQPDEARLRRPVAAIVPAAGKGSRLGYGGPKVLFPVAGTPILIYLYQAIRDLVDDFCLVVSPDTYATIRDFSREKRLDINLAIQSEPLGMGDAVLSAEHSAGLRRDARDYIVVWGDQVTVTRDTVLTCLLYHQYRSPSPALTFPTCRVDQPYIHFDRDSSGRIVRLRQKREGDDMPPQGESDCGVFVIQGNMLFDPLKVLRDSAPTGSGTNEFNFLPLIPWLSEHGYPVVGLPIATPIESVGVNTRDEAAHIARKLQA